MHFVFDTPSEFAIDVTHSRDNDHCSTFFCEISSRFSPLKKRSSVLDGVEKDRAKNKRRKFFREKHLAKMPWIASDFSWSIFALCRFRCAWTMIVIRLTAEDWYKSVLSRCWSMISFEEIHVVFSEDSSHFNDTERRSTNQNISLCQLQSKS